MADNEAAQTEIPDRWILQFKKDVAADPTARWAWKEVENAGLEEGALYLLWGYAGAAGSVMADMYGRAEEANRLMKAAIRAEEVAGTDIPKRLNPHLFRERADRSCQDALSACWPLPNPAAGVHTVGDELALAKELKSREIPLEAARKAMVKAAGERSPVNEFHFLFVLREYAAAHNVKLGVKRLVSLASCAHPGRRELDEGVLGRYLRKIPESVRQSIVRDTLPTLPPPVPRRNS